MSRFVRLLLVAFSMTLFAVVAQAQPPVDSQDDSPSTYTNCGEIDPNTPCYGTGGGTYTYCLARKANGQQCQDVVTFRTAPGTMCQTGCNLCASVNYSASCQCKDDTLVKSGTCTYW
jgi:hypothetical protein